MTHITFYTQNKRLLLTIIHCSLYKISSFALRRSAASLTLGPSQPPLPHAFYKSMYLEDIAVLMTLPRWDWVRLNRLRTGVGRFRSCLYKWGMTSSAACECGADHTVDHVVLHCPIHRPPTDYTVSRFWTIRQPNGRSTPAPISRRASSG